MDLTIILTVILPLIERATQGLKQLKPLKDVDGRIIAAIVGIIFAFVLRINLIEMSGVLAAWTLNIATWVYLLVSGFILSLGANVVNWLFNLTKVNKPA